MDKALVFGTKDCRFESCQGHFHSWPGSFSFLTLLVACPACQIHPNLFSLADLLARFTDSTHLDCVFQEEILWIACPREWDIASNCTGIHFSDRSQALLMSELSGRRKHDFSCLTELKHWNRYVWMKKNLGSPVSTKIDRLLELVLKNNWEWSCSNPKYGTQDWGETLRIPREKALEK